MTPTTTRLIPLLLLAATLSTVALLSPITTHTAHAQSPLIKGNGWLGVGLETIPLEDAKKRGFKHPLIAVNQVFADSPAEASEFQEGDVILAYNNTPIVETRQLIKLVKGTEAGSQVTFTLLRGKQRLNKPLMLAVRPNQLELTRTQLLNKPAPPFTSKDIQNTTTLHDTDAYKGKVVILDFWATWCGPCRKTIPHLNSIADKYKKQGVVILGISAEDTKTLKTFRDKTPISYTISSDPSRASAKAFMVSALPTLFLIDRKGTIREVFIGGGSKKAKALETEIQKILKEK